MNHSPLVSIIIPCYNSAHFIGTALDSALAQTSATVEILVVNDGSTDNFQAVIAPYRADPRVKIISQENRGLPAARNRGIRESHGEYLKFLDADDWLAPHALSKQLAAFQRNPALGLVYCDFTRVNSAGETVDDYSVANARHILDGDILLSLLLGGYFTPHTALVPRHALERAGVFDETLGGMADLELWMRLACENFAAQFIPEKLVFYRLHDSNMSKDHAHMRAMHLRALDAIVTRYPHRVAQALFEIDVQFNTVNSERAGALTREAQQREWIAQLERDKMILHKAANTREIYLQRLEKNLGFRIMTALGFFPRRRES